MTKEELVEIITCGETSTVQFKQQMTRVCRLQFLCRRHL